MIQKMFLLGVVHILFASTGSFAKSAKDYADSYARPAKTPYPETNKYSDARRDLGHSLFFDPRLSGSQFISCATCHNPGLGWEDGMAQGFGHGMKRLGRHTPTVLNLAWAPLLMWDGRKSSLEDQALGPIEAGVEMNMSLPELEKRMNRIKGYKPLFEKAYPGEGITPNTIAKAIATYERTLVSKEAPFDKWLKGDEKAISESAARGFVLFNEKAECSTCHSSWRFTDDSFHNLGMKSPDRGRAVELPLESMEKAFKTPTLRNITERGPYMHDGSKATLADVITFYNIGGESKDKNIALKPLNLTKLEQKDLVSFLETLTSNDGPIQFPMLPQ